MSNNVAYMVGLNEMEIREQKVPEVSGNRVLVKLEYVGICGSDVHYFEHGRIGDYIVEGDFVLGHEGAGVVVACGESVENIKIGDKVALEPGITCGKCEYCKSGNYNLCDKVEFLATPPYGGCFSNYIDFPEDMLFVLPENVSTKQGALIEPLAVGMEAVSVAGIGLGSEVVILGAGCIGLVTLLAAKASGASKITVVDVIDIRLKKAKELGATHVINAKREDVIKKYLEEINPEGAGFVIETAGTVKTTQQTVDLVKKGGIIVVVGMGSVDEFSFNFSKLMWKVAQIRTIFRYKNMYKKAIDCVQSGQIDVLPIATHEFDFSEISKAFEENITNKENVVKIMIKL